MKVEKTVAELIVYKGYLEQGAMLCQTKFRFGVPVLQNAENIESCLKKTRKLANLHDDVTTYENKAAELADRYSSKKIDEEEYNELTQKLNEEYSDAVKSRTDFLNTILDFEPKRIAFELLPRELLGGVETKSTIAFNLMTALVKLKIV